MRNTCDIKDTDQNITNKQKRIRKVVLDKTRKLQTNKNLINPHNPQRNEKDIASSKQEDYKKATFTEQKQILGSQEKTSETNILIEGIEDIIY